MSLALGLGLALTRNKGGWPADMTHDIDFVRRRYRYARRSYAAVTDLPGTTFTRATAAYGDDTAGNLILFPSGAPRITNKGVLIEEGRTNLQPQSEFASGWVTTNLSITPNAGPAPNGTTTAAALIESAVSGQHILTGTSTSKTSASLTYTASVYVAPKGRTFAEVQLASASGGAFVYVNLLTGAITNGPGTYGSNWSAATATVTPAVGGIMRIALTATNVTDTSVGMKVLPSSNGTSDVYTGDGSSGVYAWGAQLEAGSFPTSYIPTTSTSVTRNADVLASANDPNPTAYTVVAEFTIPATGHPSGRVWCWDDGTSNNAVFVYFDRTSPRLWLTFCIGGVFTDVDLGVAAVGSTYKVAAGVAAGSVAASVNGAAVVTRATPAVLPAVNTFRVGRSSVGNEWGAGIRRIRRFSVRKTNSELQALVA